MSVKIIMTTGGIASTNAFLVADEATNHAVIFDAPNDTLAPLVDEAQRLNWQVQGLWLTHGHFDHIADHAVVTGAFPRAKVLIHPLDEPKLQHPQRQGFPLPFTIPPRDADGPLADGLELFVGLVRVQVIHTPGHAPGHVSFFLPEHKILIGGDLIIAGAVGRSDFSDSDPAALDQSIQKVMLLPDETQLLPGHGQPSTLGQERAGNRWVRQALGL